MIAPRQRRWSIIACMTAITLSSLTFGLPIASAVERTFVVEMRNLQFLPNVLQAEPGDVITIRVFNNDTVGHTFDLPQFNVQIGTRASPLQPGENGTRTFTVDPSGTYWYFCDVVGHASSAGSGYTGMAGRLIVGGAAAPSDATIPILGAVGVAIVAGIVGVVLWRGRKPKKL